MRPYLSGYKFLSFFCRDTVAAGAVEFVLIVPFLLVLYVGSIDITEAIATNRRLSRCATAMNDLVTQLSSVRKSNVTDIFKVAEPMMVPLQSSRLKMRITALKVDARGEATVAWSLSQNNSNRAKGSIFPLPSDLAGTKEAALVFTELEYPFSYLGGYGMTGSVSLSSANYTRSRGNGGLVCSDC